MKISFRTIFRHLWRQRLFTFLNVIGLAIGITACWVIYGIVSYETSYERELPEKENTYRLVTGFIFDKKESYNGGVSAPFYQAIRTEVPSVKRVTPVFSQWPQTLQVPATTERPVINIDEPQQVVAIDSTYFEMVPYTWLAGNTTSALNNPDNVVLTETRARSYFGAISPQAMLGRQIIYDDTLRKNVSGIVKDLDYPSEFIGQEFIVLKQQVYSLNTWTNTNGSDKVYLQLADHADTAQVMKGINEIASRKWKEYAQETKPTFTFTRWFQLLPMKESHFSTYINELEFHKASKQVLYGLVALGVFILLLACINYINLTTAQIPQRSKEIGVRKTLGSGRSSLILQLLAETLITVALATGLAMIFSRLSFRWLADIVPDGSAAYAGNAATVIFILILVTAITLLSGGYPAWIIAKVQPIAIMRNKSNWKGPAKGFSGRKTLIVLQFMIAQVFIVGAMIMGAQLKYTLKKDMGFDKDAVVLVEVPWKYFSDKNYKGKQFTVANEFKKLPGVSMLSMGTEPLSGNYSSSMYSYKCSDMKEPVSRQMVRREVDTAYIRLYNLQLLAGRNLLPSDTTIEYVINETAARGFGFKTPQDAIGKMIGQYGNPFPVAGVVKDFHLQNFHSTIDPVALMANKENLGSFNVKLTGKDPAVWQQTIRAMEEKWNTVYPPGSFSSRYYDETLTEMYKNEHNLSKLINLATIVSILISCLGLFGLATLTALQRSKEIGIRKVLGASISGIIGMLSSDFIKLIFIALLIATPIAWWTMNQWLADFAYQVSIEWWMFLLTGAVAVVIAMITVGYQAVRAAIANPVEALRSE
ncbi:MAG: ABC transporter permease [Chitinophagaceae bacterium]